jgi:dihydroorotase
MLLIKGGRVVDPSQGLDDVRDVLIEGEEIRELGQDLEIPEGTEVIDAAGLVVTPGLINIHVHLREPGQEYKETIRTGAMAAAAGGFTAVACMANTDPVNDNRSVTEHIVKQARQHPYARVYPVGAVSRGLKGTELADIGEMVEAGIVAVSDDGLPVWDPELMRRALEYTQHFDIPVVQHAQDLGLGGDGVMHEGEWSARLGLPGMPGAAEDLMIARDLLLLEDVGGRYHVQHLSTARGLDLVRQAKKRGLPVSCEVTPHHLLLTDASVAESAYSTDFKMNPPLRSETDRQAMLAGLADGTIDLIADDHAPHHKDEKDVQFSAAPFGIVGLETTVSLCLDRLVRPNVITLTRLIELLSTAPARVMGLPGGTLTPGSPADLTLLDLERKIRVDRDSFRSKSSNTPFHGWELQGAPVLTVCAGRPQRLD